MAMNRQPGSSETGQRIEQRVAEAIERIVREEEGGMTMKWVCLLETAGPDGERGLWTLTAEDVKAWDIVGLLEHVRDLQRAKTFMFVKQETEEE